MGSRHQTRHASRCWCPPCWCSPYYAAYLPWPLYPVSLVSSGRTWRWPPPPRRRLHYYQTLSYRIHPVARILHTRLQVITPWYQFPGPREPPFPSTTQQPPPCPLWVTLHCSWEVSTYSLDSLQPML